MEVANKLAQSLFLMACQFLLLVILLITLCNGQEIVRLQETKLKASNEGASSGLGGHSIAWPSWGLRTLAVSSDGKVLIAGAYGESKDVGGILHGSPESTDPFASPAVRSGAAYVFSRRSANLSWYQEAYIKARFPRRADWFGASVTIGGVDGSLIAVGSPNSDSSASGVNGDEALTDMRNAGSVHVYHWNGTWSKEAYIKAMVPSQDDRFGHSVLLSQNCRFLAVGSLGPGDNWRGSVHIYERLSPRHWTYLSTLKAPNPHNEMRFGWTCAFDHTGNVLVISAPYESSSLYGIGSPQASDEQSYSGALYVYRRSDATNWTFEAFMKASGPNFPSVTRFGGQVSVNADGTIIACSAEWGSTGGSGLEANASAIALQSGSVYVFERCSGGNWSETALIKSRYPQLRGKFGTSVALSEDGQLLLVGAAGESSSATGVNSVGGDTDMAGAGAAYVWTRRNSSGWLLEPLYIKPRSPQLYGLLSLCCSGHHFSFS